MGDETHLVGAVRVGANEHPHTRLMQTAHGLQYVLEVAGALGHHLLHITDDALLHHRCWNHRQVFLLDLVEDTPGSVPVCT